MKDNLLLILKSILGGIVIAIGSLIYVKNNNPAGAFAFSIGLLIIFNLGYKLYTGVVGYPKENSIRDILIILCGNVIGCLILLTFPVSEIAVTLVSNKILDPWYLTFVKALLCGGIIFSCCEFHRNNKDYLVPIGIMGFIMAGAEHSIADLCYIVLARAFTIKVLIFIIIVIIGNAVGALLFNYGKGLSKT